MKSEENLLLNETYYDNLPDAKKPAYVLEWLRHLDKALSKASKDEIKDNQKVLMEQLTKQISNNPGVPTRHFIGRCLSTLFSIGDTFLLFETLNRCNDILKNKDDSPSFLPTKLAAVVCIGAMYEKLGRLMGRSYEDTANLLLKSLKNSESQSRCEIYLTLEKIVAGMGAAAASLHRDMFKAVRHGLIDRVMAVRCNAASCLKQMLKYATFLYTTELESVFSLCFRSLEGSNYELRCAISDVLGYLVYTTQKSRSISTTKSSKQTSLDDVLGLLALGFLKGNIGFLKTSPGDMIKGGTVVTRETRLGVTHAYIRVVDYLGNSWLEKNMNKYVTHLLDLLVHPKCASTHMDAVYCRRYIGFVLRSIFGRRLGEKAQVQAVKDLISAVNKYVNPSFSLPSANEPTPTSTESGTVTSVKEISANEIQQAQHALSCALLEIGCILEDLGTCSNTLINDPNIAVVDTVASLLVNSSPTVRLSAAWCMRCVAIASPCQLTPLIERNLERLETMKTSAEATYGHSFALSALLGSSCQTPLGIPQNKGKLIFTIAEDLLRTASQNSRLSLQRTQCGWQLIGGVMTLGASVVKALLPRLLLLWKNSFPRSAKEIESEKARGDAFTWHVTLENRAGALSAMSSFLSQFEKLVTEEVTRRLLTPIESAVNMLTNLSSTFRNLGPSVKASCAVLRLRLYDTLLLLPANSYESIYLNLLRLLVSEFTLTENPANTTNTILRALCQPDDGVILTSWLQDTDHYFIEDQQQQFGLSGGGAIEHDITCLYKKLDADCLLPCPRPLGTNLVNKSCLVFAHIFPFVANKHRMLMINHFQGCIKHEKSVRQEAIQLNVLAALLASFKVLGETKNMANNEDARKTITPLLLSKLSNSNPLIRCATAQAIGRFGQVIGGAKFVAEVAQLCFEKLKTARDAHSRTGHCLTLGFLHRYMGTLGSNQNINTCISILLVLSQDSASPCVQVWSLHALTLIIDSGGPMFRPYIEATLSQCLKLLIEVPFYHCDVHQCIGKLLSAIITTIGPELQDDAPSLSTIRSLLLVACGIMQEHRDPLVQAEAIGCFQQLHMFACDQIDLSHLVPNLCMLLGNPHLFIRRAATCCLLQVIQREAKAVCLYSSLWLKEIRNSELKHDFKPFYQTDHGLAGMFFYILDHETDEKLCSDTKKIITSLVQSTTTENLYSLLTLCKEVLCSVDPTSSPSSPEREIEGDGDYIDDSSEFKTKEDVDLHFTAPSKWHTRVFATETLCRVIQACEYCRNSDSHFDLSQAREKSSSIDRGDYLILHLPDLIKMAFMAATSESDDLRLEGLRALQLIIDKFAKVPEPEFPKHVILEQYQAQVGAALRPAFSPETPPHVTAMACQVCSAWIGSGVARDLNDLRRVHQLLVFSLEKMQKNSNSRLYNERASTLEKLAILKSWAEVYTVAMEQEKQKSHGEYLKNDTAMTEPEIDEYENDSESLLHLVKPELQSLSNYWLAALKDHALLTLPQEFSTQLPHDGGAFYTSDTIDEARPIYRDSWPPILQAAALWLCSNPTENVKNEEISEYFPLLFGVCMEALCNPKSSQPFSFIIICLKSLDTLLAHPYSVTAQGSDRRLSIELTNVLHRLLLTRDHPICQDLVLKIAEKILNACSTNLLKEIESKKKETEESDQDKLKDPDIIVAQLGEGGDEGIINTWDSVVYSLLEVCLCILVRHLPELCSNLANSSGSNVISQCKKCLSEDESRIIGNCLKIITASINLCSPKGSVIVLPTVLYLIVGVLREVAGLANNHSIDTEPISSVLVCFKELSKSPFTKNPLCSDQWIDLLQSSLASILDLCKTSPVESKVDDGLSVKLIEIFITMMPPKILNAPNLRYPCINLLTQALQSENESVVLVCHQTIKEILSHLDESLKLSYIHALSPKMIESLNRLVVDVVKTSSVTKSRYNTIITGLSNFETLANLSKSDKRINILVLYIPLLVYLLLNGDSHARKASLRHSLHEHALNKLISIGPNYPDEFKKIIASSPDFRAKLENAVRNQHNLSHNSTDESRTPTKASNSTIELKTDFSNYND